MIDTVRWPKMRKIDGSIWNCLIFVVLSILSLFVRMVLAATNTQLAVLLICLGCFTMGFGIAWGLANMGILR